MVFRRIIYTAIVIGVLTGAVLSLMQMLTVNPILFAAETYEVAEPATHAHDGHEGHDHDAWAPEDGAERGFYTVISNFSAGIGFAAVLLALMSQFSLPHQRVIGPLQGLAWGLAGFGVVFLAPAIGLPPEIPGIDAAPLEQRQAWWILTVACAAAGIAILALARPRLKAIGLVLLVIPYLVGAPSHEGPAFTHPDAAAVAALTELHQRFIFATGAVNLLFWLALGLACGYAFKRWFKPPVAMGNEHPA